jgi:hypothetical protein
MFDYDAQHQNFYGKAVDLATIYIIVLFLSHVLLDSIFFAASDSTNGSHHCVPRCGNTVTDLSLCASRIPTNTSHTLSLATICYAIVFRSSSSALPGVFSLVRHCH